MEQMEAKTKLISESPDEDENHDSDDPSIITNPEQFWFYLDGLSDKMKQWNKLFLILKF